MKTVIRSKLIHVTEGMRSTVEEQFSYFAKYLREDDVLDFKISKKKEGIKLSVQATVVNGEYVRSDLYCSDFYAGIKELKKNFKEDFMREYKHAKDKNKKWKDGRKEREEKYVNEFIIIEEEESE